MSLTFKIVLFQVPWLRSALRITPDPIFIAPTCTAPRDAVGTTTERTAVARKYSMRIGCPHTHTLGVLLRRMLWLLLYSVLL